MPISDEKDLKKKKSLNVEKYAFQVSITRGKNWLKKIIFKNYVS